MKYTKNSEKRQKQINNITSSISILKRVLAELVSFNCPTSGENRGIDSVLTMLIEIGDLGD